MNIEITYKRGMINCISYSPEFQKRLETYLEEVDGSIAPGSPYRRLRQAHTDLLGVVAEIVGEVSDEPYTITLKVEGIKRKYPPGPVLY